jgi:hypothetical protein
MPATPVYGLRYPAQTDPADVPTDLSELATDVEAALPNKGTAVGQVPTWDGTRWVAQTPVIALGSAKARTAANGLAFAGADGARRSYTPNVSTVDFDSLGGGFPAVGQPLIFTAKATGRYLIVVTFDNLTVAGTVGVSPIVNDAAVVKLVTATVALGLDATEKAGVASAAVVALTLNDNVKAMGWHTGAGSARLTIEAVRLS